jgi:transcriptional regulator with XRE-family HTH domain
MGGESETGADRLQETVRDLVQRSGRSVREIEREAGLGHGTLAAMLRGHRDLRVRHLELIARALGLTLEELLSRAYGLPSPQARARRDRLRALIAEAVRAELAAFWGAGRREP